MKVAFFQPYLAKWRIDFLDRYISESNYDVIVYDGGFKSKSDEKSVSNNSANFPTKILKSLSLNLSFKSQRYPLYFSPFLIVHLLKDRPDVVITEGEINFINNISIYFYCFLFKKKYIWWSLGKVRTRKKNLLNKFLDPLIDFLLYRADCVMTRNTWARDYYVAQKKLPKSRVITAPNSMDEKKALSDVCESKVKALKAANFGKQIILYVGALTEAKKPRDLLEAFNILVHKVTEKKVKLWFVGDGPEFNVLKKMTKDMDLEKDVCFFGKIFEGVGSYFAAADLVVVPGLGGLVINHAMIFGKPVISRVADGTEVDLIKNNQTGLLINDQKIESLASAVSYALEPEQLLRMSNNARALVKESWNMGIMIKRVNDCIDLVTCSNEKGY